MPSSSNGLLASLADDDFDLLEPHLEFVTLGLRKSLEKPNRRIDAVYFPEAGFASVVAVQPSGKEVEVGLIGREGMTGLSIVFGNHRSPHATYMQASGTGTCMPATELRQAFQASPSLRDSLLKFAQAFGVQTTHTAICNVQSRLDVRLARWLLMTEDRTGSGSFPLTQEYMAVMTGVQRTTVSALAAAMKKAGMIDYRRGNITVADQAGLRAQACECYALMEDQFKGLRRHAH